MNINSRFKLQKTMNSQSSEETETIGSLVGKNLQKGMVIGLVGELGAGKTCFTRGLFKGRNRSDKAIVNSPTFVVMQRYIGDLTFYHADVYRMVSKNEFLDLGLFEMAEDGVLIIEWADKFLDFFSDQTYFIEFLHSSENERMIRFYGNEVLL